jgi:hypothetical protein
MFTAFIRKFMNGSCLSVLRLELSGVGPALLLTWLAVVGCSGSPPEKVRSDQCAGALRGRCVASYRITATDCEGLSTDEQVDSGNVTLDQPGPGCRASGPAWDASRCHVHLLMLCESPGPLWDRSPPSYQGFDLSCEDAGCTRLRGMTTVQLSDCLVVMATRLECEP